MKANNILDLIGNTPVMRLAKLFPESEVWIKVESKNPGGSTKDRVALKMIEDAEQKGLLDKDTVIIEPTSGNTGIGLAMVAAVKGYKLMLVMPDSMSIERRKLASAYGAEVVLTPAALGMKGSIDKANELAGSMKSWIPMQFDNLSNRQAHIDTTAKEVIADFAEGIDYYMSGVGTGGHLTGVGIEIKKKWPNVKVWAIEPSDSPVLKGGQAGPHKLQGIGANFIPGNLDMSIVDEVVDIDADEAYEFTRRIVKEEGLLVGISTGATLAAIAKQMPELRGKRVLCVACDTGERYLSVDGLF